MIRILKPIITKNKITYPITFKGEKIKITHEYLSPDNLKIVPNIEGIVAVYIWIAIFNDLTIESVEPIDRTFYYNLMKLPNVYMQHLPGDAVPIAKGYKPKIIAKLVDKKESTNKRCASAMSGGVDSMFTLIKNKDITDLFYVVGFDINACKENQDWVKQVVDLNREIANKFGKNFIVCRSNLLRHIQKLKQYYGSSWATYTVSGGIASVIYPLNFTKLLIAGDGFGTSGHKHTNISGLHFDDLFTSGLMKVIHYDGATRCGKIDQIIKYDQSLAQNLRFCIKYSTKNGLNCGKCVKCTKTFAMLYLLGASKFMETKGYTDENYKEEITKLIEECMANGRTTYVAQIRNLLNKFK